MLEEINQKLLESFIGKLVKWFQKKSLITQFLLLLLIAGAGYVARKPEDIKRFPDAFVRWCRVVSGGSELPLTGREKKELDDSIKHIVDIVARETSVETQNLTPSTNTYSAWSIAEWSVALQGIHAQNDPLFTAKNFETFVDGLRDQTGGWKEYSKKSDDPVHMGATGWIVFAKARFGIRASEAELDFLINGSNRRGSWPMYPTTQMDQDFYGSTYATAWVALALHEQAEKCKLPDELERRCKNAVSNAKQWLIGRANKGLWKLYYDYPNQRDASLSNSGLILHFFHHLDKEDPRQYYVSGELKGLDQDWLEQLSVVPPYADSFESWNLDVPIAGDRRFRDAVRCQKLPWVIIATVDAYANGTVAQRMKCLEFTENLFRRLPKISEECSPENSWMLTELLVALRHLQNNYLIDGA
jgi:hypothetical protein